MSVQQKLCPKCKSAAPLQAQFCGSCRHQFRTQFANPDQTQMMPAVLPSMSPRPAIARKRPWPLWALGLLLLAAVAVAMLPDSGQERAAPKPAEPTGSQAANEPRTPAQSENQPNRIDPLRRLENLQYLQRRGSGVSFKRVYALCGEPDRVQIVGPIGQQTEYWYYGRYQLVFEWHMLREVNCW